MIPTKLKLYNFTAYGATTPELDFRPLNLVVLSGHNGAGKSSLLDAITWAVWGWSRAGDNADRLVRIGAKDMWVEFSFELDGTEYSITRTRKVSTTGASTLSFFAGKNNLTEGTIRATQEKIINTLHLTYDTFTNSSYLRQGHADEFTLKGPNDRKKILADILSLSAYDALEEKAKSRSRETANLLALLEVQISELEAELESNHEQEKVLSEKEKKLDENQKKLILAEKELLEVNNKKQAQMAKYEVAKLKVERSLKLQAEISNLQLEIDEKRVEVMALKEFLKSSAEIEKNYQRLTSSRAELRALDTKKSELSKYKDKALEIERKDQEKELAVRTELQKIRTSGESLTKELTQDEVELKKAQSEKDHCPLCGSEIGKDTHSKVIKEIESRISNRKKEIILLRAEWSKLKKNLPGDNEVLGKIKNKIQRLEEELAPVNNLHDEIDTLLSFEDGKRKLDVAASQFDEGKKAGLKLADRVERLKKDLSAEKEIDLSNIELLLSDLENESLAKNDLVKELRQEQSSIREQLTEAKQLVTRATQMTQTLEKKKKDKGIAATTQTDYEELALAFGKKGIQAMLIESAIPEIEEETNLLLDRLTDGRMKVELLTQRETKTSGIAETLDIIISDELGARSYEMYSGGEAFRINLALRLALSRLLTHRAGAKLQFLIIDEGFGTQDTQGKDKVVEAINKISADFAKILVVTHDAELKDSFPQRIEVTRGENGSTFETFI